MTGEDEERSDDDGRCGFTWVADDETHTCLFRHDEGSHLCDCGLRSAARVGLGATPQ